jgi:hypothetical protein
VNVQVVPEPATDDTAQLEVFLLNDQPAVVTVTDSLNTIITVLAAPFGTVALTTVGAVTSPAALVVPLAVPNALVA